MTVKDDLDALRRDSDFTFSDSDRITNPGKFEGQHIAILYFLDCFMNGNRGYKEDEQSHYYLLTDEDRAAFGYSKDTFQFLLHFADDGSIFGIAISNLEPEPCQPSYEDDDDDNEDPGDGSTWP